MNEFMTMCGTPILAVMIIVALFMGLMAIFDPEMFMDIVKSWSKYYEQK